MDRPIHHGGHLATLVNHESRNTSTVPSSRVRRTRVVILAAPRGS
jgi:hypothetical protein